ncbi:MAG: zinc ribbon domain-containing protein [Chloroflexi bacterium]|nr:MAG: zinc ribbon domain-containing protein [Chloroflexota bacterium]
MPLYEYFCPTCQGTFETLRPAAQADQPALCPKCQANSTQRVLSLVASSVVKTNGGADSMMAAGMGTANVGGGCCGGACGCHH